MIWISLGRKSAYALGFLLPGGHNHVCFVPYSNSSFQVVARCRRTQQDGGALCPHAIARGYLHPFVRRQAGPQKARSGGGNREYPFHEAILERRSRALPQTPAGQNAAGKGAAALFLDQQGPLV